MDIHREFNKVLENLIANHVREYELACYKYYANYVATAGTVKMPLTV